MVQPGRWQTMANIGKWALSSVGLTTVLTTGLNSLAINTISGASATYDNSANLDLLVDIEVLLASLSPTAGAFVAIYALTSIDGTNFPAQSDSDLRLTVTQLLCSIPIGTTAATAQRVAARNILLPPKKMQFKLDNQTGVALAASGNTVSIVPYDYNLNG
jgi:hypothetical protein